MAKQKIITAGQTGLLGAICDTPDADAPRLVYADWLDEHGDPTQACFIRESIAAAALPAGARGLKKRRAALQALADEHGAGWLRALGVEYGTPTFVRGFAEVMAFEGFWRLAGDAEAGLFRTVPVCSITVDGSNPEYNLSYGDVRELAAMPELARLHTLKLGGCGSEWGNIEYDPKPWEKLFASGSLGGLRRLDLDDCNIADEEAIALADSRSLAGLTTLFLRYNGVGAPGLRAVIGSKHLGRLKDLWLVENNFGSARDERRLTAELRERFGTGLRLTGSPDD
jgi:uncharacterized protein (TIGR02996 family)